MGKISYFLLIITGNQKIKSVTTYNIPGEPVINRVLILKLDDDLSKQVRKGYIPMTDHYWINLGAFAGPAVRSCGLSHTF